MKLLETIKRVGLLIGAVVMAAGMGLLFLPDLASQLPFNLLLGELVAFFGVVLALIIVRTRYNTEIRETDVPKVEYRLSSPSPGSEIDSLIYRMIEFGEGKLEYRERIYDRLEEVARSVIADHEGISDEQAMARLREGSWTDNPTAARFFGAQVTGTAQDEEGSILSQWWERRRDDKSEYEREIETVLDAIENVGQFYEDDIVEELEERTEGMSPSDVEDEDSAAYVLGNVRYMGDFATRQWLGLSAFALTAIGMGVVGGEPSLVLAAGVGIAAAGYSQLLPEPGFGDLEVTRELSETDPEPGDEVDVTVTVRNTGDSFLPDLRLVDRVPPTMEVVDGSPRMATALRPDTTATFEYTLVAERGTHTWPLQVVGRDVAGAQEKDARIDVETELDCVPRLKTITEMPVRMQTSMYEGGVDTNEGGPGLEFFSVRDYQPGDAKKRIDWKTFAKTGEFTTIDFREENAARVTLLFDARSGSYVAPVAGEKHALDKSIDAAIDVFASLYDQGHLIGIAAFNGIPLWLGPNTGQLHLERVRGAFTSHPAITPLPPELMDKEEGRYIDPMIHIRRQMPANTQIFLFSPLTDHYTYEVARRLNGAGHLVTVVSPNPTTGVSIGNRIARLERTLRVKRLRDHGIRVVDWNVDEEMRLALSYAQRRWS